VPLRSSLRTLCGTLVAIGTGENRRIVTIVGMVETIGACYALTTSHLNHDSVPPGLDDSISSFEFNEDDYDDEIDSPLIIDVFRPNIPSQESLSDENDEVGAPGYLAKTSSLGTVERTGSDWALVKLDDPQFALPNAITESEIVGATNKSKLPMRDLYLGHAATEPKPGPVKVLTSANGTKTMQLMKKLSSLRLPSGAWVRTWKVKFDPKSGDSTFPLL